MTGLSAETADFELGMLAPIFPRTESSAVYTGRNGTQSCYTLISADKDIPNNLGGGHD